MNALGWMHRKFNNNNSQQVKNVSTRKSYSCFSTLWGLEEQQYYHEPNSEGNEQETVDMSPEFFHSFLAIGTLGSILVSITEEPMTPKVEMSFESETEEELFVMKLEKIDEKEIKGMDTKENKSIIKEYSEMPARIQKTITATLFKKNATSYKRHRKLERKEKTKIHALNFMKKMVKKVINFTSVNASFCDSTEKKMFRKSRKVHPQEANPLDVKNMYYDEQMILEDEGNIHPLDGMLKKEKAHWIKTDEEYFVLEF
ncbi:hypothetical protein Lser_V15G13342 [Lactuca serriola]